MKKSSRRKEGQSHFGHMRGSTNSQSSSTARLTEIQSRELAVTQFNPGTNQLARNSSEHQSALIHTNPVLERQSVCERQCDWCGLVSISVPIAFGPVCDRKRHLFLHALYFLTSVIRLYCMRSPLSQVPSSEGLLTIRLISSSATRILRSRTCVVLPLAVSG
jgi:hypothetical protein